MADRSPSPAGSTTESHYHHRSPPHSHTHDVHHGSPVPRSPRAQHMAQELTRKRQEKLASLSGRNAQQQQIRFSDSNSAPSPSWNQMEASPSMSPQAREDNNEELSPSSSFRESETPFDVEDTPQPQWEEKADLENYKRLVKHLGEQLAEANADREELEMKLGSKETKDTGLSHTPNLPLKLAKLPVSSVRSSPRSSNADQLPSPRDFVDGVKRQSIFRSASFKRSNSATLSEPEAAVLLEENESLKNLVEKQQEQSETQMSQHHAEINAAKAKLTKMDSELRIYRERGMSAALKGSPYSAGLKQKYLTMEEKVDGLKMENDTYSRALRKLEADNSRLVAERDAVSSELQLQEVQLVKFEDEKDQLRREAEKQRQELEAQIKEIVEDRDQNIAKLENEKNFLLKELEEMDVTMANSTVRVEETCDHHVHETKQLLDKLEESDRLLTKAREETETAILTSEELRQRLVAEEEETRVARDTLRMVEEKASSELSAMRREKEDDLVAIRDTHEMTIKTLQKAHDMSVDDLKGRQEEERAAWAVEKEGLQGQIEGLKGEMSALLEAKVKRERELEKLHRDAKTEVDDLLTKVKNITVAKEGSDEELEAARFKVQTLVDELMIIKLSKEEEIANLHHHSKFQSDTLSQELVRAHEENERLKKELKQMVEESEDMQKRLTSDMSVLRNKSDADREFYEVEIGRLKDLVHNRNLNVEDMSNELTARENAMLKLEQQLQDKESKAAALRAQVDDLRYSIESHNMRFQAELREVESAKRSSLAAADERVQQLKQRHAMELDDLRNEIVNVNEGAELLKRQHEKEKQTLTDSMNRDRSTYEKQISHLEGQIAELKLENSAQISRAKLEADSLKRDLQEQKLLAAQSHTDMTVATQLAKAQQEAMEKKAVEQEGDYRSTVRSLEREVDAANDKIDALKTSLSRCEVEKEKALSSLEASQVELKTTIENHIAKEAELTASLSNQSQSSLHSLKEEKDKEIQQLLDDKRALQQNKRHLEEYFGEVEKERDQQSKELLEKREEIASLKEQLSDHRGKLRSKEHELLNATDQLLKSKDHLSELGSQLHTTQAALENTEIDVIAVSREAAVANECAALDRDFLLKCLSEIVQLVSESASFQHTAFADSFQVVVDKIRSYLDGREAVPTSPVSRNIESILASNLIGEASAASADVSTAQALAMLSRAKIESMIRNSDMQALETRLARAESEREALMARLSQQHPHELQEATDGNSVGKE